MSLIEGWYPPTRENYERLLFWWQIGYPIVSSESLMIEKIIVLIAVVIVWFAAMGYQLVWYGQNVCEQQIQHSWPAGLDHDGVSWILDVAVRYEYVAAESRCR